MSNQNYKTKNETVTVKNLVLKLKSYDDSFIFGDETKQFIDELLVSKPIKIGNKETDCKQLAIVEKNQLIKVYLSVNANNISKRYNSIKEDFNDVFLIFNGYHIDIDVLGKDDFYRSLVDDITTNDYNILYFPKFQKTSLMK